MELTTLSYVKQLLGRAPNETSDDSIMRSLIQAVSARAELYLKTSYGIEVLQATQTDYFDIEGGTTSVRLGALPLVSIDDTGEGAWSSAYWVWDSTTVVNTDNYRVDTKTGRLYFSRAFVALSIGDQALKVVYTAGLVEDVGQLAMLYPGLVEAVSRQVLYLFNTRKYIGESAEGIAQESSMVRGDVAWLDGVKKELDLVGMAKGAAQ